MNIDIITCPEWGARAPKADIVPARKAVRIIVHHTAGHHQEISLPHNESRTEAIRYARAIQNFHMDTNGWTDSGHNFLVCRNGMILQGRWGTVSQIQAGRMVVSAHCPGQNTQIGIEHEHLGTEPMTDAQRASSAALNAWISSRYGRRTPLPLAPHSKYYSTACPANLKAEIPRLYQMARTILGGL
jgi:hypothetical protein